ncbi:MAG TPA: lytic transglycosylase domain-containing protein [Trebonia sp.]|nr:lytic transglycosylase domain-containing protein [Trebonia sp.]
MAWEGAEAGGSQDAGAYPGTPGRGSAGWWVAIGISGALVIAIVAVLAVRITGLQGVQPLAPQVTNVAPQAVGGGTGGQPVTPAGAGTAGGGEGGGSGGGGSGGGVAAGQASLPLDRIDSAWAARVAAATGIPDRAMLGYASADLTIEQSQPACGLGWNTLAAIGTVESANGTFNGTTLLPSGYTSKPIIGVTLSGGTFGGGTVAAIPDTDHGALDGDPHWDHAVGPMQFLPATWEKWGTDGNGDGVASPNQIDDAALTAARYLCASGAMTTPAGWRAAVFSYNQSDAYVDEVATIANRYAAQASASS